MAQADGCGAEVGLHVDFVAWAPAWPPPPALPEASFPLWGYAPDGEATVLGDPEGEWCRRRWPPALGAAGKAEASGQWPRRPRPEAHAPAAEALAPLPPGAGAPNLGSVGHPEMCVRPCIYYPVGTCANGAACDFCHLAHPKRAAHLDKRNRDVIRSLSFRESVLLVLPIIRERVREAMFRAEVLPLFEGLAPGTGGALDGQPEGELALNQRQAAQLAQALRCLNMRSLLAILQRAAPLEEASSGAAIDELAARMRFGVAGDGVADRPPGIPPWSVDG